MSDLLQLMSMLALPASVLAVCRRYNRRSLPNLVARH